MLAKVVSFQSTCKRTLKRAKSGEFLFKKESFIISPIFGSKTVYPFSRNAISLPNLGNLESVDSKMNLNLDQKGQDGIFF